MKRGYRERPLLDEDLEPTTRAMLLQAERGDQNEYEVAREWRVPIDPALVEQVAAMQRRAS